MLSSLRWVVRHRAWTPYYLIRYWRFAVLKITRPHVVTDGFVLLGKGVRLEVRKGYGRLRLGRWVHLGNGAALRAHEGTLRIGDKVVIGEHTTVNCYLDIEIGATTIIADWVHITDFDHVYADVNMPIKDQGIAKSPVRIGPDCWLGVKSTVTRGVTVGRGSVVGAHAVVTRDVQRDTVVAGVPARVIKRRRPPPDRTSGGTTAR